MMCHFTCEVKLLDLRKFHLPRQGIFTLNHAYSDTLNFFFNNVSKQIIYTSDKESLVCSI